MPFEDPTKNVVAGFFATAMQAASPVITAPAFRQSGVLRASIFFALSFVPLALLSGVIPYTALVLFKPNFVVEVDPATTDAMLWMDVGRSALLGLVVRLVEWLAVAIPFVSLTRAYEDRGHPDAPLRAVLYRGWLLPAYWLAFGLAGATPEGVLWFSMLLAMLPLILLLTSLRAASRMGSGVGPVTALLTVGIPFAMMIFANRFSESAMHRLVPDLGALLRTLSVARCSEVRAQGTVLGGDLQLASPARDIASVLVDKAPLHGPARLGGVEGFVGAERAQERAQASCLAWVEVGHLAGVELGVVEVLGDRHKAIELEPLHRAREQGHHTPADAEARMLLARQARLLEAERCARILQREPVEREHAVGVRWMHLGRRAALEHVMRHREDVAAHDDLDEALAAGGEEQLVAIGGDARLDLDVGEAAPLDRRDEAVALEGDAQAARAVVVKEAPAPILVEHERLARLVRVAHRVGVVLKQRRIRQAPRDAAIGSIEACAHVGKRAPFCGAALVQDA